MMRQARPGRGGFTLLEVVGVIVILGLITAAAKAPMGRYLQTLEQKNAVTAMRKLLQTARGKAMANPSVHCGVWFDFQSAPPRAGLFLDTFSPGNYAYDPGKDKAYLSPFILPKGAKLTVPEPYPAAVIFRGDGSAYLSGRVQVRTAGMDDTLDVLASTGRIRSSR